MSFARLLRTLLPALALLAVPLAHAQSGGIDRAPQPIDEEPTQGYDDDSPTDVGDTVDSTEDSTDPAPANNQRPSKRRGDPGRGDPEVKAVPDLPATTPDKPGTKPAAPTTTPAPTTAAVVTGARTPPKPILLPQAGDAELIATWEKWRKANADLDTKAADAAQAQLISLKDDLGIDDLETFGVAFARASHTRLQANDPTAAVALATAAVQLAPDIPMAHLALARAYLAADPAAFGTYAGEVERAISALWKDPRYRRPALADLGAALIFALLATAVAVTLVLFFRRARYFLHDFHHLFPKAAAHWQSAAIAVLLLSLPVVFRLGVTPLLLTLFAAVALYLSLAERIVAAALIALVGLLPLVGGLVVDRTAFAETVAEDLQQLERGGLPAGPAADRVRARAAKNDAGFAELFSLARYELRRGQLEPSIAHFKLAAAQRTNDAAVLTNLGNALFAQGDLDGAAEMYRSASAADPSLAAPLYNLAKLYTRHAATLPDDQFAAESDRARNALSSAQKLDESLLFRKDPPDEKLFHNRLLLSPTLSNEELDTLAVGGERGDRVRGQLALAVIGPVSAPLDAIYPAVLALALLGLGFAAFRLQASKACDKCGRPVCRRCDPELGMGSQLCNQCVNVFARKAAVQPQVKVRKQAEVDRYQGRMDRLSYLFGLLCSGAGHLFSGLPVRGAIYAFLSLFLVFNAFFRLGVLRAPYGAFPELLRLIPIGLVFALVYGLSLRGLYKRQSG